MHSVFLVIQLQQKEEMEVTLISKNLKNKENNSIYWLSSFSKAKKFIKFSVR